MKSLDQQKIVIIGASFVFLIFFSLFTQINVFDDEEELEPLFSVHLIAPVSGSGFFMRYAELIEEELVKIGINAELDLISWAALGPRAIDQEVGMYSENGYDICFFGLSLGSTTNHLGDSLLNIYGSESIPPNGFNVPYWSPETGKNYYNYRAQESDDLIKQINTNLNLTSSIENQVDWQKVWYDAMPNILVYNRYEVHAISSDLFGYDPLNLPLASIENQWNLEEGDTTILAISSNPKTFNAIQATDVISRYAADIPMDRLVGYTPSTEVVLPTGVDRDTWMLDNFGTTNHLTLYPRMATSLGSFSDDGLQYNISVRDDIYWHDGHRFDGWDVAFSFQSRLIPEIRSPAYSELIIPFGKDNKSVQSGNYSFIVEDKDSDGFFESISFQFVEVFSPWITDYLGSLIYPEHILGDPINHGYNISNDFDINQWLVHPANWSTHSTSTGRISDPGGFAGPIGTGSMIFREYNISTGTITFQKFENLMWNGSNWTENASYDHYLVKDGFLDGMPISAQIISLSLDAAINEMTAGNVHIIDPKFTISNVLEELQTIVSIRPILVPETGWQALYMNPKFIQDGTYHFQKKGVRHAISHVIPRVDITHILLNDFGVPAYTPLPSSSPAAISESDMISFKQSLTASDGSKPLENTTTAYDNYSIPLALDWLETEGYNVTRFRDRFENPPVKPQFSIEISPETFIAGAILIVVLATYIYVGFRKKN